MSLNTGSTSFREFSPGDATIAAFGQELVGWKHIKYESKRNSAINKTGNNKGTSYSMGDDEDTCTLEMYMSEIRKWEKRQKTNTGNSSILGMKVQLAVTYFNEDLEEVTDSIYLVITGQGREVQSGSDGLAYELQTLCLGIDYDA